VSYRYFSEGWSEIISGDLVGLVNSKGQVLVAPKYNVINEFTDGMALVRKDTKWGLIDTTGREILPCQYQLRRCGYRLYLLEQNGRYGLFAPDYGVRIEPAYEELGFVDEENGWVRARKNGKWGWVDKTGKVKVPFRFDAAAPFKNGRARVLQLPYKETFYINEKGEMILGE
ncbi:MAG: WG repeat-containing protein, partial [Thermoanaerobaculia bacterium]|nr:WG repeat-containing protein [Thermoanaerobaculia bacterium]